MSILNVEHLTHGFGDRAIFSDVSFRLLKGEHIGLVGANGEGKSTFMSIVTGKLMPDEGKVEWAKNVRVGYLDQHSTLTAGMTIESVLKSAFSWLFALEEKMNQICDALGEADESQMDAMMEELGVIQDTLTMHDFYTIDAKVEEVARALGLLELGLHHDVTDLSGGQRMKVLLAKLLLEKPDILLLDEPTSNLDAAAIAQLHDMIAVMKRQGVTVVLAEHRLAWITDLADRYFFFAAGRLAAQWSAAEFAALPAGTLAGYGLRARTLDDCRAGIRAKQSARCPGTPVLTLEGVTLGCDKKHPLRTLPDMSFAAGEIVGLMGRNGIGKSTMARTLCGLLEPVSGKICRNGRPANARERLTSSFLGMQDVNYQLFSDSVREEVLLGAAHPERCDAVLQALGLDGLADRHPMSLSGGQKQRVVVAAATSR